MKMAEFIQQLQDCNISDEEVFNNFLKVDIDSDADMIKAVDSFILYRPEAAYAYALMFRGEDSSNKYAN